MSKTEDGIPMRRLSDPSTSTDVHVNAGGPSDRSQPKRPVEGSKRFGSRLISERAPMTMLIVIISLIGISAIVCASLVLSRPKTATVIISGDRTRTSTPMSSAPIISSGSFPQDSQEDSKKRIWLVAVGHDYGAHDYIDGSGYLAGFNQDIVDAVCREAKMDCRTVWDKYSNCWASDGGKHAFGGQGIMAGWYDACTGWAATVERLAVFSFSMPFIKTTHSYFFVARNSTSDFDWRDITGNKIGFLHGWASNDECVARWTEVKGSLLRREQIVTFHSPTQLRIGILDGEVDAGFAGQRDMEAEMTYLDQVGLGTSCFVVGQAMVTRKDSDFISFWNVGFQKLVASGKFKKLCEDTERKHGHKGDIGCVDS